jgi:hypothetical protein
MTKTRSFAASADANGVTKELNGQPTPERLATHVRGQTLQHDLPDNRNVNRSYAVSGTDA